MWTGRRELCVAPAQAVTLLLPIISLVSLQSRDSSRGER
jgi:hypothetical protein